jgi:phage/plasmid-like protein (TIGR03299 family)
LQNSEAFKFFDTVVERDEAVYETAGSLAGGKKVWLLAKLPDYVRVGNGDDVVEKYVLLTNTHDGSKPVIAKITPVRVVCNNTLNLALNTKRGMDEVSVRHSTNMVMNLEVASKTIGLVNKIYSQVEDIFNAMSESKLTVMEGEAYVKKALQLTTSKDAPEELVTQSKITFDSVMGLVEHGAGTDMPMVKGTLWGYYNAVTEYVDHYRVLNKKTERMDALVFGSGAIIKERSLAVAKQYLEGAMM